MTRTCLSIVLAAGEGVRMRSSRPKVLHAIGGAPLIAHVLAAVREVGGWDASSKALWEDWELFTRLIV